MKKKSEYLRGKSKHLPYVRLMLSRGWILRVVLNDDGVRGYWLQKETEPEMLFAAAHYDHTDAKRLSAELGDLLIKETVPFKKFKRTCDEGRSFQVWQLCTPDFIEEKSRFQL